MENNTVNSFWGLIHANKWMKITFVLIISFLALVIAGCIIYGFTHGYAFKGKYGDFAPAKKDNDSIIIQKQKDTIQRKIPENKPRIVYIKSKPEIAKPDTAKEIKEPTVNVTSLNQSGGITANKVTIEKLKKDRILKMHDENTILVKLPNKNESVIVWALMGDAESYRLAIQIYQFLNKSKYTNVYPNIRSYMRTAPFYGVEIKWNEKEKTNNVYVGSAPED